MGIKAKVISAIIFVIAITSIILLAKSLRKLSSTTFGVEYTAYSKQLDNAVKSGGIHMGPPGFEFIKFPSTYVTEELPKDSCVSHDGLRVEYKVSFQYRVLAENVLPVITKYRNFAKWASIVSAAGASAVQHACSEFNISNFQNQRGIIQARMEEKLRLKLEGGNTTFVEEKENVGLYAEVVALQLTNLDLPSKYTVAINEKQGAAEAIALATNERTQKLTQAQTLLLGAQQEARKINDTAVNDVILIQTEAQLKAQETIVAFDSDAELVAMVKNTLNLTTEGVLSYLANRLYADAPTLQVKSVEPAQTSYKNNL